MELKISEYLITKQEIQRLLKPRAMNAHKGVFGHGLLISGSRGKMGAVCLSAKACMRSGIGLLTVHVPACGEQILQVSVPEAMLSIDSQMDFISELPHLDKYNAIGVGPAIGVKRETQQMLKLLIQNTHVPLVLDADALNILSENKTWISFLPAESILTPHVKEFERLTQPTTDEEFRRKLQKEFSVKHKVYVVLKGANTCISTPEGNCYINTTGNPGMATAGSGDVLTGIILGLLAQGYKPFEAACIAVFLHGLAGDLYVDDFSEESLIASDLTDYLEEAFKRIKN